MVNATIEEKKTFNIFGLTNNRFTDMLEGFLEISTV